MPTSTLTMRFDLRVPPFAATDFAAQYRACLEMAEWGDRVGVAAVVLSEHHGDEAGYLPSPITMAAAVLARTARLHVSIAAVLAPLHDPVRLAEQLAVLDCLGPGRLSVIFGGGYRTVEFEMAGVERRDRGRLVEDAVNVCRLAWTGQPFEWHGRRIHVTPPPASPGGPTILVGGKKEVAARRAARLRCAFAPSRADEAMAKAYWDECEKVGYEGTLVGTTSGPSRPGFVMISNEPDATWDQIAPNALYDAESYASWQEDGVQSDWVVPDLVDANDLRTSGRYVVVTPEECVELVQRDGGLTLHPLMGGIPPELAWDSLRLFERDVLPHLSTG